MNAWKWTFAIGLAVIGTLLALTIIFKSKQLFGRSFSAKGTISTSASPRSSLHSTGDATGIVNVIGRNSGHDLIMKSNFRAGKSRVEWSPSDIVESTRLLDRKINRNTANLMQLKSEYLKYADMDPTSEYLRTIQQNNLEFTDSKIEAKSYEIGQLNEAKTRLTDYATQNKKLLDNYEEIKDTLNDAINNSPKKSVTFDDNIVKY